MIIPIEIIDIPYNGNNLRNFRADNTSGLSRPCTGMTAGAGIYFLSLFLFCQFHAKCYKSILPATDGSSTLD
jgi:hypothetical protein